MRALTAAGVCVISAALLAACGSTGPPEAAFHGEAAVVSKVIHVALETNDPSNCDRYATQHWLEQTTALHGPEARYACHRQTREGADAGSLRIEALHVRGEHAGARIALSGGAEDGITMTVTMVKTRGWWRFHRVARVKFDRPRVNHAIVASALRGVHSRVVAKCTSTAIEHISDAALEHAFVDAAPGVFLRPVFECGMRAGLGKGVPEPVADCLVGQVVSHLPTADLLALIDPETPAAAAANEKIRELTTQAVRVCVPQAAAQSPAA